MDIDTPDSPTPVSDVKPGEREGNEVPSAEFFEVANDLLGTQFKDNSSAEKYIKDNLSFVNKAREIQKNSQAVDESKFVPREQYDTDTFFSKNPEYAVPELRGLIEASRKATGKSLQETVNTDDFKAVYGKYKAGDEFEKSKSVIHSNPRIGAATDKISEAREALAKQDVVTAERSAVDAVLGVIAVQEGR